MLDIFDSLFHKFALVDYVYNRLIEHRLNKEHTYTAASSHWVCVYDSVNICQLYQKAIKFAQKFNMPQTRPNQTDCMNFESDIMNT